VALEADPAAGPVLVIPLDAVPVPWMGIRLAAGVTLDTDVTLGMASLAGLEIASCFDCMFINCRCIPLVVGAEHQVRLDPHTPFREAVMACRAVFLVMAAIAALWVVQSLDRMDIYKIAAMALGDIIPAKGIFRKVCVYSTSLVAIEAERLIVALSTVSATLACKNTMAKHPVAVMVGCYSFTLVTAVALGNLHVGIFLV